MDVSRPVGVAQAAAIAVVSFVLGAVVTETYRSQQQRQQQQQQLLPYLRVLTPDRPTEVTARQLTAAMQPRTMQEKKSKAVDLATEIMDANREGWLPFTKGGVQVTSGVNKLVLGTGRRKTKTPPPMRDWRRNASSMSVARHTQHKFMWEFVDSYGPTMRKNARCLDWDGWYIGSVFASVCAEKDVIEYGPQRSYKLSQPKNLVWRAPGVAQRATRWYMGDAMTMASVLDHGVYDLIIANSVFEHLKQPFVAMQQIATLLRPGGLFLWHTPFEYENHGVPFDFFRYTVSGARAVAESAGLRVESAAPDGGYVAVLANLLGLGSHHWTDDELARGADSAALASGTGVGHYLSTRLIARKPVYARYSNRTT
jgi:SAM-dependent methyltransferase